MMQKPFKHEQPPTKLLSKCHDVLLAHGLPSPLLLLSMVLLAGLCLAMPLCTRGPCRYQQQGDTNTNKQGMGVLVPLGHMVDSW